MDGEAAGATRITLERQEFSAEQQRLWRLWTFLGFADDVKGNGAWMRSEIAGRSVFVQNIKGQFKGFENVCPHRRYPIRTADRGRGAIICGYHHFGYDAEGRLAAAPKCEEVFGATPSGLGLRLRPIEVATCGDFVFGRFPGESETLEAYLDKAFPVLEALSKSKRGRYSTVHELKANWRLYMHISLEDYHIAAIHPRTFGRNGIASRQHFDFLRFGRHSCRTPGHQDNAIERLAEALRTGTIPGRGYRVFHLFPTLVVSLLCVDEHHWYVAVMVLFPKASGKTIMQNWVYEPTQVCDAPGPWYVRWSSAVGRPTRDFLVHMFGRQINREDIAACEAQQPAFETGDVDIVVGALEEKIAWFEQTYSAEMARQI